jgi:fatty-acyl-CoA synthase
MPANPTRHLSTAAALSRAWLRPERIDRLPRAMLALLPWGPTLAGGLAAATARYPLATAIVDDDGALRFRDVWWSSDAVARGLRARGVGPGSTVGILGRNHRSFVLAVLGASKLGADIVYLNTGFAGPQLADVIEREGVDLVIHDDDLIDVVTVAGAAEPLAETELAELAAQRSYVPLEPTRASGRTVILTSGTTGRPKGASRAGLAGVSTLAGLLAAVPARARDTVLIAAPLFHAWGLSHLGLGLAMSSTIVLQRGFDPEATLDAIARHGLDGLVVVPVMLQRIIALGDDVLARYDTSSLRYIASSGSALGAGLATAVLDHFGPILYNVYGSTEVALATIATPDDLRTAPSTAGRPVGGTAIRILDEHGAPVATGERGRVFVGSDARFDGYTGGGTKETIDGLLATGDVGHVDGRGLLFIDGRDDEMIVSGGENVYPAEVEDVLASHPAVAEAACVGAADEQFGQRLLAFVVLRPGATLTEDEAKRHVRATLARYKVPRSIEFVAALPRTTTGKVRKRDLTTPDRR